MLLVLTVILGIGICGGQIIPPQRPENYDCAIRSLSLARSVELLNGSSNPDAKNWPALIYAGLRLHECNNGSEKGSIPSIVPSLKTIDSSATSVYISPTGDDTSGDGSESNPYFTVERALLALRGISSTSSKQVLLLPGKYYYGRAMEVGAGDSGVTIQSADPSNRAEIVGSVSLSGLSFSDAPAYMHGPAVKVASLPSSVDLSMASHGLQVWVDGVPYVQARWPNANPMYDLRPTGYATPSSYLKDPRPTAPSVEISSKVPVDPNSHFPYFTQRIVDPQRWHEGMGVGGAVLKNASVPANLTGGFSVHWDGGVRSGPHGEYPDEWMNYGYFVESEERDGDTVTLQFGAGGWQGLNSDSGSDDRIMYVSNAPGALDIPGEVWIDAPNRLLYIYPNGTTLSTQSEISIAQLKTTLRVQGTARTPVANVTIADIVFSNTRATFMDLYEPPSSNIAGWSYFRGAAVEVEGADHVSFSGCSWNFTGGNGLLLSGHCESCAVRDASFSYAGDSGILAVGYPAYSASVFPSFPNNTQLQRIIGHDLGLIGKQVSVYSQFLAANTHADSIVAFNQPRAAINLDDGFTGGHVFERMVLFQCVRESADHGAVNSWSREPYYFVDYSQNSQVSIEILPITITRSLILAAGGTLSNLDHDDGSWRFNDTFNVLAYAGAKNYLGREKTASDSLFLFPDLGVMSNNCFFSDGDVIHAGFGERYVRNTCIMSPTAQSPAIAKMTGCDLSNTTTCTFPANNTYFVPQSPQWLVSGGGVSLQKMQSAGLELGSTVNTSLPTPSQVISMAKSILQM